MERQADDLMKEFDILKTQYKHLDEEKRKVELRQNDIEEKMKLLRGDK